MNKFIAIAAFAAATMVPASTLAQTPGGYCAPDGYFRQSPGVYYVDDHGNPMTGYDDENGNRIECPRPIIGSVGAPPVVYAPTTIYNTEVVTEVVVKKVVPDYGYYPRGRSYYYGGYTSRWNRLRDVYQRDPIRLRRPGRNDNGHSRNARGGSDRWEGPRPQPPVQRRIGNRPSNERRDRPRHRRNR